ncbi:MAG TPA: LysR family transcriptional regulator [Selenomonadales bacterium]|nr:LysR family transcriptional regulator [Selenomonadales bacterium]
MEIIHLKYFIEVARHRSFSKAAAASHVSQSVVSKLIKDLERELDAILFSRTARQVTLTDFGTIFLAEAEQVVTLFNNLIVNFDSKRKLPRGKITIGLPLMTNAVIFAQFLGEFKKRYPDIEIQLYEYGSKKIELAVQEGLLDIGIICRLPGNPEIYDYFSFSRDPLRVVVHPEHALAGRQELRLAHLAGESFILSSSDFSLHDEIIKRCGQAGFQPKIVLETSQRELMVQSVAANLGITLMPANACATLSPALVRTIPLVEPEIVHCMSAIWRKGRPLSYPAKLCLDFAREYFLQGEAC